MVVYLTTLRIVLICCLGVVGGSKIVALIGGADDGHNHDVLPPTVLWVASVLEISIVFALATRWWRIGAWSAAVLGVAFVCGLVVMLALGKNGCEFVST